MAEHSNGPRDLHALLIAVDHYLPGQLPNGEFYPDLEGTVRDVSHVESFLRETLQVPGERITKLTSPRPAAREAGGGSGPLPSYENIIKAFGDLTDRAGRGDQVYIHYSGHGGRAATKYPDRKGPDGLDETLVPYDIHLPEAQYLRDLEIHELLKRMTDKGLHVTAVFDCCHSGGLTRGASNRANVRGVAFVDTTPRPAPGLVVVSPDLTARGLTAGGGALPTSKGYTLFAACRPTESAYEFPFDGHESNGALTYWLLDGLQQIGPGLSYKMVFDRVMAKIHSQFERQSPMLEGEADRVVFGVVDVPPRYAVDVMKVDALNARVLLQTGQAQGVRKGTRFAIESPKTTDGATALDRKAVVEITTPGAADSWALLVSPPTMPDPPIEQGDQAVLLGLGSSKLVRAVALIRPDGAAPTAADTALHAVSDALKADTTGWVVPAQTGEPAECLVTTRRRDGDPGEVYEICDRSGSPIVNLPADLAAGSAGASAVVARLVHLARFRAVQDLDNFDVNSTLKGKVVAALVGVQDDYQPGETPDPKPFPETTGSVPTIQAGQWTFLRIRNTSRLSLNVAVLDLQSDWGIAQVYPRREGLYTDEVGPGEQLPLIPLKAGLPRGIAAGTEVLKVFATLGAANFRVLTLPVLGDPSTGRGVRAASRGLGGPLDLLLAAAAADTPTTRALRPGDSPSNEWTVVSIEVHIKKGVVSA